MWFQDADAVGRRGARVHLRQYRLQEVGHVCPEALINAIGGRVSGVDGRVYSYASNVHPVDGRGVIATPTAAWHSAYLARIPQSVVDSLCASAPSNE